jgi:hypothetical protein
VSRRTAALAARVVTAAPAVAQTTHTERTEYRESSQPIVYLQANTHAGEVEGKILRSQVAVPGRRDPVP